MKVLHVELELVLMKNISLIATSDHTTSEIYFFNVNEDNPKLKLFKKRQKEIKYSVDSWKGNFYIHTNLRC